jgi:hypothetical protein
LIVHKPHPVKLIIVHPDALETTVKACEQTGLSSEMIVLIRRPGASRSSTGS